MTWFEGAMSETTDPNGPGLSVSQYEEKYLGNDCIVLEIDGEFGPDVYAIEKMFHNSGAKVDSELNDQVFSNRDAPGGNNGTGFFQTLCSLKLREVYEALTATGTASEVDNQWVEQDGSWDEDKHKFDLSNSKDFFGMMSNEVSADEAMSQANLDDLLPKNLDVNAALGA